MKGIVNAPGHVHGNKTVLDGITAEKVREWNEKSGGGEGSGVSAASYESVRICNSAHVRVTWKQEGGIGDQVCESEGNSGRYELVIIDGGLGYAFSVHNDRLGKTAYIKASDVIAAAARDGVEYAEIAGAADEVKGVRISSGTRFKAAMYYDYSGNGVSFTDTSGTALIGAKGSLSVSDCGAPVFYGLLYESMLHQAMRGYAPTSNSAMDALTSPVSASSSSGAVYSSMYGTGMYYVKDCPVPGESGACVMTVNASPLQYEGDCGALAYVTCFVLDTGNQYGGLFMDRNFYLANRTKGVINAANIGKWYKMTGAAVAVE